MGWVSEEQKIVGSQGQWLTPVILELRKLDRRIVGVPSQPGLQCESLSQRNKRGRHDGSARNGQLSYKAEWSLDVKYIVGENLAPHNGCLLVNSCVHIIHTRTIIK